MTDNRLAAIVRKPRGEEVLSTLRSEGVYDDSRRIIEHSDGTLAIPITKPPDIDVIRVIQQKYPEHRPKTLDILLRDRGWSDQDINCAPSSWAVIGSVILVAVPDDCPDESELGDALLELHGHAETVLARNEISGQRRIPDHRVIAGTGNTETIHEEHGVKYKLDLSNVMFSPGNKRERTRMAALIAESATQDRPATTVSDIPDDLRSLDGLSPDEHVFDMFAGIGYFTLPAAVAGASVTAAEINPTSFEYLCTNLSLNNVDDRVTPYRTNCRNLEPDAVDRVVMGHYDSSEYLQTALQTVQYNGVVHYHALVPDANLWSQPADTLTEAASSVDRDISIEGQHRIKSYAEGIYHVVIDARVF